MIEVQPKDFKYTLIIGTTDYPLNQAPIGWDENILNFKRDSFYKGMRQGFTLPLDFVTQGAKILRSQYYQFGIEAFVRLRIDKLNVNTWLHEQLYLGIVDFEQFEDKEDTVTVTVSEGGIYELFKAYDNVKYDIDLNDSQSIMVEVPGIGLNDFSNSIVIPVGGNTYYPAIDLVINELLGAKVTAQNTNFVNANTPNTGEYFASANEAGTLVRFNGSLEFNAQFITFGVLECAITSTIGLGAEFVVRKLYSKSQIGVDVALIDFDFNVDVALNQKFYLKFSSNRAGNTTDIVSGRIDISYSTTTDPINVPMLKPKRVLELILRKMNGGNDIPVRSFLLDNITLGLTSGSGIRNLDNSKIKTSLKEFFKSLDCVYGVGLGVDNSTVIFENYSYFFTETLPIANVGNIKDPDFKPAKEYLFSSLKLGYKDYEYQEVDGIDEFNSTQDWTFPIRKVTTSLDLISDYRADVRGIEEIRKKLLVTNEVTTDIDSDNDTFMIKLKPDFLTVEGFENYISVTGVSNPEKMYNMDLSPKKNLLRNLPLISSMLSNLNGTQIIFQSAAKNANLVTVDLLGNYVKENENIKTDTILNQRLYYPLTVSFKSKLPIDLPQLIASKPYGVISFNYLGNNFKGYVLECSIDASKNTEREFKLLISATNDLTKLIR